MVTITHNRIWRKVLPAIILVVLVMVSSCKDEKEVNLELNASEVGFNEILSSISKDGNDYYIGTENGRIYRYNSISNNIDTLYTRYDRIYKVKRKGDTYWIGSRNHGLHRCHVEQDNLGYNCLQEEYTLYRTNAKDSIDYSCYDILIKDSTMFVATSNGLYYTEEGSDIHKLKSFIMKGKTLEEKVVNSLLEVGAGDSSRIFCASEMGLLEINPRTKEVAIVDSCKTNSLSLKGDTLMVFSINGKNEKLTARNLSDVGTPIRSFTLSKPAKYYYNYGNLSYFINSSSIQIINDEDLWKSDAQDYVKIVYPHKPIRLDGHNLFALDEANSQSLLLTSTALLKVACHQDIFNQTGKVVGICDDGDDIYYMVDGKHLYVQRNASKSKEILADQIYDLPKGLSAEYMTVTDGTLYFTSDKNLYRVDLKNTYLLNSLFASEKLINTFKADITAIGSKGGTLYIGVRDSLLVKMKDEDSVKTQNVLGHRQKPFINVIHKEKDRMYFTSLNDGVYDGNNTDVGSIQNTNYKFIRDIDVDDKDSIYLLTNHNLYKEGESGFDTLAVYRNANSPLNRVIVSNKSILGIGDRGIYDLNASRAYFQDIQFIHKSCLLHENKLFLGSSNGVFVFDMQNGLGLSENPQSVNFVPNTDFFTRRTLILLFCIIVSALGIVIWLLMRKHRKKQEKRFIQDKKEAKERFKSLIDWLKDFNDESNLLKEYCSIMNSDLSLDKLEDKFKTFEKDVDNLDNKDYDDSKAKLERSLSEMHKECCNFLDVCLNAQKKQLTDDNYQKDTESALKSDVDKKKMQIIRNRDHFINEDQKREKELNNIKEDYKNQFKSLIDWLKDFNGESNLLKEYSSLMNSDLSLNKLEDKYKTFEKDVDILDLKDYDDSKAKLERSVLEMHKECCNFLDVCLTAQKKNILDETCKNDTVEALKDVDKPELLKKSIDNKKYQILKNKEHLESKKKHMDGLDERNKKFKEEAISRFESLNTWLNENKDYLSLIYNNKYEDLISNVSSV